MRGSERKTCAPLHRGVIEVMTLNNGSATTNPSSKLRLLEGSSLRKFAADVVYVHSPSSDPQQPLDVWLRNLRDLERLAKVSDHLSEGQEVFLKVRTSYDLPQKQREFPQVS